MGEVSIDVERVGDGAQIVEIMVDHHPFGIGVCLDLMADDGRPCGGVNDEQIRFKVLNRLSRLVKGIPKLSPPWILVRCKHRMRVNRDHKGGHDLALTHPSVTSWA